jgi:predicted phage tail protein
MITVKLLGELGRRFGRQYELAAVSAAHVVHALAVQIPGFAAYLYQSEDKGIGYRVVTDDPMGLSAEELQLPVSQRLVIAPVVRGAGAVGRILAGVALIGAAALIGPGIGFLGINWGSALLGLGASMVLGGIAQLLTPTPSGAKSTREAKRNESYLFDRAVEVGDQGLPVPLLYGERYISALAVISSGLSAEDIRLN